MSRIDQLVKSYHKYIKVPWRDDAAALQRVIFCVYPESEELRLRYKIDEFDLVTKESGHEWLLFDLTNTFPEWLVQQRYADKYFEKPQFLSPLLTEYQDYISTELESFLTQRKADTNTVVALQGVGSLFGFLKVKDLIDELAPKVSGRLLVFFPGSYENNNYRLLNGYDGWNYLAVPITPDNI